MVASVAAGGMIDGILRLTLTVAILAWNVLEGAVFENTYPWPMVKLYRVPLWTVLLLVVLLTGADWCPSVGLMIAFAIFFYIMDMEVTREKWTTAELKRAGNPAPQ